jgi:hypothetical protein
MSLFIPEGYCQLHFASRTGGQKEVTFALAFNLLDPTPVDLEAAYDAYATFGGAIGWGVDITMTAVRSETGTADPAEPILEEFTGSATGSGSTAFSPPQVSFLVKKRSAVGGRKNRGRVFIPHVRESVVDFRGDVESSYRSGCQDAFDDFVTAVGAAIEVTDDVILHTNPADTPTPITSYSWESKVATQRRRFER